MDRNREFFASFRVVRSTLQIRKLWCRDRPKRWRHAARSPKKKKENFFNQKNPKKKNQRKKEASKEYTRSPRRLKTFFFKTWYKKSCSNGGQKKSDFELKEEKEKAKTKNNKIKLLTLKVALRPSGVLLVFSEKVSGPASTEIFARKVVARISFGMRRSV